MWGMSKSDRSMSEVEVREEKRRKQYAPLAALFCLCLAAFILSVLLEAEDLGPNPGRWLLPPCPDASDELLGLRRWMMNRMRSIGPRMNRTRLLEAVLEYSAAAAELRGE